MALQRGSKTFTGVDILNQSGTQNVHMGDSIQVHAARDEQWSKIKSWIFMPNFALDQTSLYNRTQSERKEKSTGQWLLESAGFTQWKEKPNSVMWLRGKVGCGKTILCSSVARQLMIYERSNRASVTVAHYYITTTDPQTQGFDTLLRSLIYQIGASTENTRKMAEKYYNNADLGNREPYLDELYDLLKDLLKLQPSVFIIIDALDESKELDTTLEFIEKLVHWSITGVHLLLSSRELPSVQRILLALRPAVEPFFMEVRNAQVKLDIERHLRKELERGRRMWSEKDKQRIIHDVVKSSEGIFRYISVPISDIGRCQTSKELNHVLDTLPKTLNGTYENFLSAMEPAKQERAKRILESITLSKRSLTLMELAHTIPVNSRTKPYFDESVELRDPTEILDICGPLIVFEDFSELENSWEDIALDTDRVTQDLAGNQLPSTLSKILLAHSSVKDYLLGDTIKRSSAKSFSIVESDAALTMAETLLAYGVHVGTRTTLGPKDSLINTEWPLFQYAVDNWYFHADDAKDFRQSRIESLLLEIRHSAPHAYRSMTYPQPPTPFNPLIPPELEPLKLAPFETYRQESGTPSKHQRRERPCKACKQLRLGDLKKPQRHPLNFQQLQVSAGSRCPVCILLLNSLVYQWISRRSNHWPILTDSDTLKAEMTASEAIASKAESSSILLYGDATGDPFLVVQCLHMIGRLSLQFQASTSILEAPKDLTVTGCLIPKISQWLRTCENQHISCTRTPSIQQPFRLVEVGDDSRSPHLLTIDCPLKEPPRYTTLSYILEPPPHQARTVSDNIARYCSRIPLEAIPSVIMEAITLTRRLGIQFLWVDTFCIVQNNTKDRAQMLKELPAIFSNSYLNIVAGALGPHVSIQSPSTNACRFPDYYSRDDSTDLTIKWPGSEAFYNMCGVNPEHYPNSWRFNSPAHRRAWILQEIRLAPRNLVFQAREDSLHTEQVYMQCNERVVWESGLERCTNISEQTDERLDWYRTVELFSSLKSVTPGDKIPNLSEMARKSAKAFGQGYTAGLWITDLIHGLLWYRPQPGHIYQGPEQLTPPTWSWAFGEGRCVHYWPHDVVSISKTVEIRQQTCGETPNDLDETYMHFDRRLSLIIEARMLQIDWSLCTKTSLEHTYNIGFDQFKDRTSPLRASCWFDTKEYIPSTPGHCKNPIFMIQLTQRAGLLLIEADGELKEYCEIGEETFIRIGLFVVAKSAGYLFESAETRQITVL